MGKLRLKINRKNLLYDISIVNWIFYSMIVGSTNFQIPNILAQMWQMTSLLLLFLSVVLYTFLKTKILHKKIHQIFPLVYLLLIFIGILVMYKSEYPPLLAWILMTIASVGVSQAHIVKLFYWSHIILLGIVVGCALMGFISISEMNVVSGSSQRYGYGFTHPNVLGMIILVIVICWCYLHWGSIKLTDIIFIAAVSYVTMMITDSASSLICTIFMMGITLAEQLLNKRGRIRIWYVVVTILLFVGPLASYYLMTQYTPANVVLLAIDLFTTGRIRMMNAFYVKYGISMYGQEVFFDYETRSNLLFALDNSYAYILIRFGVVMFVLYLLGLLRVIVKASKNNDSRLVICLLTFVLYGLFETYFMRGQNNFTLLMMASVTFEQFRTGSLLSKNWRRLKNSGE